MKLDSKLISMGEELDDLMAQAYGRSSKRLRRAIEALELKIRNRERELYLSTELPQPLDLTGMSKEELRETQAVLELQIQVTSRYGDPSDGAAMAKRKGRLFLLSIQLKDVLSALETADRLKFQQMIWGAGVEG